MAPHELQRIPWPSPNRRPRPPRARLHESPASSNPASDLHRHHRSQQRGPPQSMPASLQCCGRQRAQRSHRSSPQRNGSNIRSGAFLPVSSARNSGSTLFQSKPTKVVSIASRMAKLRLPLRTGPNRRPDAMQKKRRSGRASTKTSLVDEIEVKPKRGRPSTGGRDPFVGIRLPKDLIEEIDAWTVNHESESRSEAIRRLVELGLSVKTRPV